MPTLDQLRSNRSLLFWTLHAGGWAAFGLTQYLGALLTEKSQGLKLVIVLGAVAGFVLSTPMRFVYRALWGKSLARIVAGVLITSYVTAIALRVLINLAFQRLVEREWSPPSVFGFAEGALSTAYLLVCWSALYFGIRYYESLQSERETALRATALAQEAQLKMLRYQLNPHFLFNTLNAISTLILDNQNGTANQAVTRLADFLRYTLDQDPVKTVTLRQELEALRLYLNTEQLRFGERLHLTYSVEDQALDARVPSLLLQPLIENAVKYAVSPREAGGSIRIEGRARAGMLEIAVVDNGPGMGEERHPGRGVGLRNTRERLAVLYGERHRFMTSSNHPGTRVEIAIPLA